MYRIPVLLLTGYLGSGKTTLVNHLLANRQGIRYAVIVNDIGEVNIDASLIQKGGIVGQSDESLVALQNGCICCTLKMDLIQQLSDLVKSNRFDYIVIEASGICEPEPIARTIASIPRLGDEYTRHGYPYLDCIVTVVDALRMQSEFDGGNALTRQNIGDEDLERLVIEQIEFCNIVLLNKVSEISSSDLQRLKLIIQQLNPDAQIIECDYARVDIRAITHTGAFIYSITSGSAGWVKQIERPTTAEEDADAKQLRGFADPHHDHHHDDHHDDDHDHHHDGHHDDHHHHHDHHHEGGEVEEYGIGTFVYYRRQPFDLNLFDRYVNMQWPKNVIRTKGVCYFANDTDMSYLFEQAGVQKSLREAGQWYATMPEAELIEVMRNDPGLVHDWDADYGDRMQKLVFIGQHLDREAITRALDNCLV